MVQRVVEGSDRAPGRPVRYWEIWNEPELAYAWNPSVGDFSSYLQAAVTTLDALDTFRRRTANPKGRAMRTVFDDPKRPPRAIAPSVVLTVPARSLVLVDGPGRRRNRNST